MSQTYLIDGVNLEDADGRWRLERATKLPSVGNPRVASLEIPGRDGVIAVPQGTGSGQVGLSILVIGADSGEAEVNRLALVSLLHGARTVTWSPEPGVYRHAGVSEVAVSEPVRGLRTATIHAALTVQPFWRSGDPIIAERPLANGTVTFPELEGVTGKLQDAIIRIKGPLSSLSLTDPVSGTGLVTGQALTAAQYLYVDTATWDGWVSSSDSAWPGGGSARFVDFPAGGQLALWPGMVPVEVQRNYARDPGALSAGSPWGGFSGGAGYDLEGFAITPCDWSKSGSAWRGAWHTKPGGLGDLGYRIAFVDGYVPDQPWTLVVKGRASHTSTISVILGGGAGTGRVQHFTTPSQVVEAGEIFTCAVTFSYTTHTADSRVSVRSSYTGSDFWVELSEADAYPGPYQPEREWASGDYSPDPSLFPSWTGTPNNSPSILSKLDPARKAPRLIAAGTGLSSASRVAIRSRRWFL